MAHSTSRVHAVDLRVEPLDEVLDRVAHSLRTRFDPGTVVRKRRSVGARTDRDTWVRVERRPLDKITEQVWNGTESAGRLQGVAQPAWRAAFSLFDREDWGNAPQGLDAATLCPSSLAVPALADRVRNERRRDFESRHGKLMTLFVRSKILGPDAHRRTLGSNPPGTWHNGS